MQLPSEFSPFIEKKVVFSLVDGGVTPLPPLSGPTTKNHFFYSVLLVVGSLKRVKPPWPLSKEKHFSSLIFGCFSKQIGKKKKIVKMRYRLLLDSKKNGISVGRVNLSGPTIKKPHFFMCVFPM